MDGKMEFAIFCIENVAEHLNMDPPDVYDALSGKSRILKTYIIPNYEVLHTQSKEDETDDLSGNTLYELLSVIN